MVQYYSNTKFKILGWFWRIELKSSTVQENKNIQDWNKELISSAYSLSSSTIASDLLLQDVQFLPVNFV